MKRTTNDKNNTNNTKARVGRPSKRVRKFNLSLDADCGHRLERYCQYEGYTFTAVMEIALNKYLDERMH